MNGTQTLLLFFVGIGMLGIGYAIAYVMLKSKASPATWDKLVDIVATASKMWGKVYTVKQATFFAKRLYDGLKLDASSGYTLEEFTEMWLLLVPVSDPSEAAAFGESSALPFGFDEAGLQSEVQAIMVSAMRDLEAEAS